MIQWVEFFLVVRSAAHHKPRPCSPYYLKRFFRLRRNAGILPCQDGQMPNSFCCGCRRWRNQHQPSSFRRHWIAWSLRWWCGFRRSSCRRWCWRSGLWLIWFLVSVVLGSWEYYSRRMGGCQLIFWSVQALVHYKANQWSKILFDDF